MGNSKGEGQNALCPSSLPLPNHALLALAFALPPYLCPCFFRLIEHLKIKVLLGLKLGQEQCQCMILVVFRVWVGFKARLHFVLSLSSFPSYYSPFSIAQPSFQLPFPLLSCPCQISLPLFTHAQISFAIAKLRHLPLVGEFQQFELHFGDKRQSTHHTEKGT